jgi:hypothetical protein
LPPLAPDKTIGAVEDAVSTGAVLPSNIILCSSFLQEAKTMTRAIKQEGNLNIFFMHNRF